MKTQTRNNRLRQVIEGTNPCPTLLDIECVAQKSTETNETAISLTQHEEWVENHLSSCEACQRLYQMLLASLVTRAESVNKIAG